MDWSVDALSRCSPLKEGKSLQPSYYTYDICFGIQYRLIAKIFALEMQETNLRFIGQKIDDHVKRLTP